MHSIDFSFIVCSNDDSKFDGFKNSVAQIFGQHVQLIRIRQAKSLSEGYNLGVNQATGRRLVFCHDDIEFISTDSARILCQDLDRYDLVGVAGTSLLVDGKWNSSGHPYLHGQTAHVSKGRESGYQLCSYGLGRDHPIVDNIQALDGLFIAVNRKVTENLKFDSHNFDGFHLYDIDFTYSAYLMGFRIAVDARLYLLHHSDGCYNETWNKYALRFCQKHCNILPKQRKDASIFIKRSFSKSLAGIRNEMQYNSNASRINIDFSSLKTDGSYVMTLRADNSCSSTQVSLHQRWPVADNTINFIRIKPNGVNWLQNECFLAELFRTLRNTAVLEIEEQKRKDCNMHNDQGNYGNGVCFDPQWPKEIPLNSPSYCKAAMVLQSDCRPADGTAIAYYQLRKHWQGA